MDLKQRRWGERCQMQRIRADILGCLVDVVDYYQAMNAIAYFINEGQCAQIVTANAEMIYQACEMHEYRDIINQADLVTPDGIGTVLAGRYLGYSFPERVTGIDLLYKICAEAVRRGWSLYLLGAAPGVAQRAAFALRQKYSGLIISGTRDGFFEPDEEATVLADIKSAQPDVLLVAMGAPRQDMWIGRHREELGVPLYMGVGGSFDVISGDKKRAPQWMRNGHLEWFFRLLQEPSRFRRQLARIFFIIMVIRKRFPVK